MESPKFAVLATYRYLLRSITIAFKGDVTTWTAARNLASTTMRQNRKLTPNSIEAGQQVEHAQGVAQILRENVVQGKRVGNEGERYKLNIHEHTQRMDNDTAGRLKGTTKSFNEIKNSQF